MITLISVVVWTGLAIGAWTAAAAAAWCASAVRRCWRRHRLRARYRRILDNVVGDIQSCAHCRTGNALLTCTCKRDCGWPVCVHAAYSATIADRTWQRALADLTGEHDA